MSLLFSFIEERRSQINFEQGIWKEIQFRLSCFNWGHLKRHLEKNWPLGPRVGKLPTSAPTHCRTTDVCVWLLLQGTLRSAWVLPTGEVASLDGNAVISRASKPHFRRGGNSSPIHKPVCLSGRDSATLQIGRSLRKPCLFPRAVPCGQW